MSTTCAELWTFSIIAAYVVRTAGAYAVRTAALGQLR
jgi:hypothetical protein